MADHEQKPPEMRWDAVTGAIVLRDGESIEFPWLVVWAWSVAYWGRVSDEVVLGWPRLTSEAVTVLDRRADHEA